MSDIYVLYSQRWLNRTYNSHADWVALDEDGITGWQTIYGLRRALQVELEISPLASAFGELTRSRFISLVGRIDETTDGTTPVGKNLLMIVSCALWCKGAAGLSDFFYAEQDSPDPHFNFYAASIVDLRAALGLGSSDSHVDVKMMAWLLSMDTYRLISGGTASTQNVQRWLNRTYADQPVVDLVATHGLFTRSMQVALMITTQLEIGFSPDEATGTFGPQTRARLRGDPEYPHYRGDYFNHLFQAWLTVNGYPLVVDGDIGPGTQRAAETFRTFMALPDSYYMSAGIWMALMVSCGDPDRKVAGFDYALQLDSAAYQDAWDQDYRVVGRYMSGVTQRGDVWHDKFLDIEELNALKADPAKAIDVLPIYQVLENDASYMTYSHGQELGILATQRAQVLGFPENSIVFFAVDFDAYGTTITGPVMDFFRGINDAVASVASTYSMRVGVYGARNVCDQVAKEGLAVASFVAGATYGWSANMGYPMPQSWHYNQIQDTHISLNGSSRNIDKVAVSPNSEPVSLTWVAGPPPELDGRESATGFNLDFDWFVGAVHDVERRFAAQSGSYFDQWRDQSSDYLIQAMQYLSYSSPAWQAYTPYGKQDPLNAAVDALIERSFGDFGRLRDAKHFAAALRGHERYGIVPQGDYSWTLGDFGGWGLDLYSLWVQHAIDGGTISSPETVYQFVLQNMGSADSLFSMNDLVADADAVIVAHGRRESGADYIEVLRDALRRDSAARISRFYDLRFGSNRSVVVDAVVGLATGADNGAVSDAFGVAFNIVCQTSVKPFDPPDPTLPKPTFVQAEAMGRAFADFLEGL